MKTLIIKGEGSSFERYFKTQMRRENIDVESVRNPSNKLDILSYYIVKELRLTPMYSFWLKEWKKNIKNYDNIIVFDNGLSPVLLKWLHRNNRRANIKVWLWNIDNDYDIEFYKKYAQVYCFDKKFARDNNIFFIDQFYIPQKSISYSNIQKGIFYVGADKKRYSLLKKIAQNLNKDNISHYFYLRRWPGEKYDENDNDVILSDELMPYEDVIKDIQKYECILELNLKEQEGFTLRTLEALFYKRKLITNNKNIKKFDFYNKNDFYVLGDENRSLKEFMDTRFKEIDDSLLENYTYDHWLNQILN